MSLEDAILSEMYEKFHRPEKKLEEERTHFTLDGRHAIQTHYAINPTTFMPEITFVNDVGHSVTMQISSENLVSMVDEMYDFSKSLREKPWRRAFSKLWIKIFTITNLYFFIIFFQLIFLGYILAT